MIGNMRAITAVNSESEVPEGVSNSEAASEDQARQTSGDTKFPTRSILEQKRYRDERRKRQFVF